MSITYTPKYADFALVALDGTEVPVHRIVLEHIPFFAELFARETHSYPLPYSAEALREGLSYLYARISHLQDKAPVTRVETLMFLQQCAGLEDIREVRLTRTPEEFQAALLAYDTSPVVQRCLHQFGPEFLTDTFFRQDDFKWLRKLSPTCLLGKEVSPERCRLLRDFFRRTTPPKRSLRVHVDCYRGPFLRAYEEDREELYSYLDFSYSGPR